MSAEWVQVLGKVPWLVPTPLWEKEKRDLVPLRSGSLQQIFKSSYCLPNQCLFLHINMLTLILFLDFIQEIFGVISRKFCVWKVLKECRTLAEDQSSPQWLPTCSCKSVFPEEEHKSVQTCTPKSRECGFSCKWVTLKQEKNIITLVWFW